MRLRTGANSRGWLELALTAVIALSTMSGSAAPVAADTVHQQASAAELGSSQFVDDVRKLGEFQQRAVSGDRQSITSQVALAAKIAEEAKSLPAGAWADRKHAHALVKYVLSGGDPSVLSRALGANAVAGADSRLAAGALAYVQGESGKAEEQLAALDHRNLPPSLAGHVALIRAILALGTDRLLVMQLCDEARLLSPGTWVEEAAHRLAIELAIANKDKPLLANVVLRYAFRFPASEYASAVDPKISQHLADINVAATAEGQGLLDRLRAQMPERRFLAFAAGLAEASLRAGRLQTALYASDIVLHEKSAGAEIKWLATAIKGAAMIFDTGRNDGLVLLGQAEPSAARETHELIENARHLAAAIKRPPQPVAAGKDLSRPTDASGTAADAVDKLLHRGKARIQDIESLLASSTP